MERKTHLDAGELLSDKRLVVFRHPYVIASMSASGRQVILLAILAATCLGGCARLSHNQNEMVHVELDSRSSPAAVKASERVLDRANHHLERGHSKKAETLFREAIELNPDSGAAYNNLGLIHLQRRELYEAASAFGQASMLTPESGLPHYNLGIALEEGGLLHEAITHYELAHSMEPTRPEFLGNLIRARIASGDVSDEVGHLLRQLIVLDKRPEWIEWARDELAIMLPGQGCEEIFETPGEIDDIANQNDEELKLELPEL